MKIAMLSWESLHTHSTGGLAVHVTELAAALQRRGHEIHLFLRRRNGQPNYLNIHGVHHHLVDQSSGGDFIHEIHNMNEAMVDRFMQVTRTAGIFDLVHGHDWLTAEGMVQIKERWSLRGILTMHSTEFGRNGNHFHSAGDPWRIAELERYGTYCANQVIAISHFLKDEVMRLYQCPDWKMSVIHNGTHSCEFSVPVDTREIKGRYGLGPLDPMILFAGRATMQKGPDLLLESIPAILKEHPQSHVVFATEGPIKEQLKWRTGELHLHNAVRFVSRIPRSDLVHLVCASDIVVVPSRNEPFGIIILEAWSAGKPVVVTINGGPNEFVDQEINGIKVAASTEGIAWGLNHLMNHWDHARWLGENGKKTVAERFSWNQIGESTERIYSQLLQR